MTIKRHNKELNTMADSIRELNKAFLEIGQVTAERLKGPLVDFNNILERFKKQRMLRYGHTRRYRRKKKRYFTQ